MENKTSVKISSRSKEFLTNIRKNRIKIDLEETNFSTSMDLITDYFKSHNKEYMEMIKGGIKNA